MSLMAIAQRSLGMEFKSIKSALTQFASFQSQEQLYPLWSMQTLPTQLRPLSILITAGTHGDEPAGVYTLRELIEENYFHSFSHIRFVILPCLNPQGFELAARKNILGEDLNRHFFPGTSVQECALIQKYLVSLNSSFFFHLDLHETAPNYCDEGFTIQDNPQSFYLYEHCEDKKRRIGPKLIDYLKSDIPICSWEKIYHDHARGGVISYPEACANLIYKEGKTLDHFLNEQQLCNHSIVTETPSGYPLEKRMAIQKKVVHFIVEQYLPSFF